MGIAGVPICESLALVLQSTEDDGGQLAVVALRIVLQHWISSLPIKVS